MHFNFSYACLLAGMFTCICLVYVHAMCQSKFVLSIPGPPRFGALYIVCVDLLEEHISTSSLLCKHNLLFALLVCT